ncbi:MAG: anhydro-N-acetylmuramic acid kinase, partial [Armatimonadota bacterium]
GCVVVHDFRSADVVAGGHGAPLVPCVDALLHRSASEDRILLNVGGVANVTWLPAGLGTVGVRGFDTGPGNCLMDAWAARLTEGRLAMDPDGAMAARGNCDRPLLERLRSMPGLELGPPRSFDRGAIEAWADPIVSQAAQTMDPETILATLAEFTATTISDAIDRTIVDGRRASVWISGGGARNPILVSRLRSLLAPRTIATNELQGVPPDAKESFAFAVLADAALRGQRLGLPSVTGAASPSLLGSFAFP